jgi:carboxypeptidase family protein
MNRRVLGCLCVSLFAPVLAAQTRPLPPAVYGIKVRVEDHQGGPVQDATVQLLGVQKGSPLYRRVPGFEARTLAPKDFTDDFARLADLPAGDFVLMVESPLFAKTLSKPFTVPANSETEVVVALARGSALAGTVIGPDKKPVAGAVVRTESAQVARSGAIAPMLAAMFVDTLTATSATTGADGTFALEHLAAGKYRLVVDHAEFVRAELDTEVGDAAKKLPPIQLEDGVLVTGRVMRGAQPVAGAEVTFQFEDVSAEEDPARAIQAKTYRTKTDERGDFRLPARVPPGKGYVLMAAEPGTPLAQASQFAASRRRFDVRPGNREQAELLLLK